MTGVPTVKSLPGIFREIYGALTKPHLEQRKSGTYPITIRLDDAIPNKLEMSQQIRELFDCHVVWDPNAETEVFNKVITVIVKDVDPAECAQGDICVYIGRRYEGLQSAILALLDRPDEDRDIRAQVTCCVDRQGCKGAIEGSWVASEGCTVVIDRSRSFSLPTSWVRMISALASLLMNYEFVLENTPHHLAVDTASQVKDVTPHNRIELNYATMFRFGIVENERIYLMNPVSGRFCYGIVKMSDQVGTDKICLSKRVRDDLDFAPALKSNGSPGIWLAKSIGCSIDQVTTQGWKALKNGQVTLSAEAYDSLTASGARLFQVKSLFSGWAIDVSAEKLMKGNPASAQKGSRIQLSYAQRQLLDLHAAPLMVPHFYMQRLNDLSEIEESHKQMFAKLYERESIVLQLPYADQAVVREVAGKLHTQPVSIYPVFQDKRTPKQAFKVRIRKWLLKNVWQPVCDWTVGAASVELRCIRPHATDESTPVIRVTPNVQKLLGIEDTDDVIVGFRNHRVKARVLTFQSLELARETNIVGSEGDLNLCIGIPSFMRSDLKMESVGYSCTLHRDTTYLFFKNLNIQLIPIIGVVLAVFQLPLSWAAKYVLISILTPVAIFFTFSQVRGKVKVGRLSIDA